MSKQRFYHEFEQKARANSFKWGKSEVIHIPTYCWINGKVLELPLTSFSTPILLKLGQIKPGQLDFSKLDILPDWLLILDIALGFFGIE